ncbi:MAG: aspartate ammonia-lyase, partial [Elusimicrobia bacterium]|nr:aspartate ammonia-lyase [Elusimicrobiota bacterium]
MRIERDALGEREVPDDVYYGIHTVRNIENFPVSGIKAHPKLVWATALIKKAAAETHLELKLLPEKLGRAILQACEEILSGKLREQFVIDVFQMGAGTSHNMNANEVVANRAIELLGGKRGDYSVVHPNDHVNMSQSTNDVFPTAIRLASLAMIDELMPIIGDLRDAFREKEIEFNGIWKSGRTHLQDAVPMRLGQEFGAYAAALGACMARIDNAASELRELNLGATAIGAGTNTHPRYRELVIQKLQNYTEWPLRSAYNLFAITQNADD